MSALLASIPSSSSMGVLSNKIKKADLKAGDHIYTWRTLWVYAHHGIYVGDDKVIHFTSASGQKSRVTSSSLSCFLEGGDLFLYEYAVSEAYFLGDMRGTCTVATADPDAEVVRRAKSFLTSGFGSYDLFNNNCENFAVYCKTGKDLPSLQVFKTTAVVTAAVAADVVAEAVVTAAVAADMVEAAAVAAMCVIV